jgi:hypothetical protein
VAHYEVRCTASRPRKGAGRLDRIERVGKRDHRVGIGTHHFRVSTIHVDPGNGEILTIDKISVAARTTNSVGTTEEADANSLSDAPLRGAGTNRFDTPYRLIPMHPGKTKTSYIFKVTSERLNAMSGPSVTAAKTGNYRLGYADFSANAELSAESDEV